MKTILILAIIFVLIRGISNILSKKREQKHKNKMFERNCMKREK